MSIVLSAGDVLKYFVIIIKEVYINMGILGLAKLIADVAPSAINETDMKSYFGMYFVSNLPYVYSQFYNLFSTIHNVKSYGCPSLQWIIIGYANNILRNVTTVLGRKIAIDASMSLYQFLIAVRSEGNQLTSVDGETTRFVFL